MSDWAARVIGRESSVLNELDIKEIRWVVAYVLDETLSDSEMRLQMINWIFLCFLQSPEDGHSQGTTEWMQQTV